MLLIVLLVLVLGCCCCCCCCCCRQYLPTSLLLLSPVVVMGTFREQVLNLLRLWEAGAARAKQEGAAGVGGTEGPGGNPGTEDVEVEDASKLRSNCGGTAHTANYTPSAAS